MREKSPMPFQLVNDSATVAIAGRITKIVVSRRGTATIRATTIRSTPVSRLTRLFAGTPEWRPISGGPDVAPLLGAISGGVSLVPDIPCLPGWNLVVRTGGVRSSPRAAVASLSPRPEALTRPVAAVVPPLPPRAGRRRGVRGTAGRRRLVSAGVDAGGLLLDARLEALDVVGLAEERLDRGDHDGRGERRVGVTVEELGDVLRRADELHRLLLQRRVRRGVGLVARHQRGGVGLGVEGLRLGARHVREQRLGARLVLGAGR